MRCPKGSIGPPAASSPQIPDSEVFRTFEFASHGAHGHRHPPHADGAQIRARPRHVAGDSPRRTALVPKPACEWLRGTHLAALTAVSETPVGKTAGTQAECLLLPDIVRQIAPIVRTKTLGHPGALSVFVETESCQLRYRGPVISHKPLPRQVLRMSHTCSSFCCDAARSWPCSLCISRRMGSWNCCLVDISARTPISG